MNKTEFYKEFGEQIRRDLEDIEDLKDERSKAFADGRRDVYNSISSDIRAINESIYACASAYLGIEDFHEAIAAAREIATDGRLAVTCVREIRERTGLSQRRFSARYEIPTRTIENWESGKSKAPDYVIKLLARVVWEDFPNKI